MYLIIVAVERAQSIADLDACECQGCVNLPIEEAMPNNCADETSDEETDEEKNESNHSTEEIDMEIITEDFLLTI